MAAQHRAGKYPGPRDPSATDTIVLSLGAISKPLVETAPAVSIRTVFRAFWPFTAQFRTRLYLSLGMVVFPPLLGAASMWMLKILIDDVLTPRNTGLFPKIALAFVALTVCGGVVSFIDEYLNAWVAERFVLILRSRVFDHLQTLSLTFFGERQLGDLLSRLTGDINAIEQLILSGVNQTLTYVFQILFFSGALFWLDWRLALAAFIAAPGFMLLARFFSRRIKNASRELRRRSGSITSVAEESLHNIALVQAYHQEATQSRRFRAENLGSFAAQMLATKLEALFAPFTDLMQMVGVLLVVGLGIRELVAGRVTLGGLLVFLGYLSQLYGPISGFGHLVNSIYAASAGADRIFELLDTRPEAVDPEQPKRLERVRGALRVERLGFRYPDTERPTLHGVSFSVEPGETVAVVGASGAGKSTLLRLLLRLHQQAYGTVLLDGVDTRELTIAQLRSSIAVVLQETLVFDGTIEENIRWGRPDATDVDVVEAARTADAHSFITGLPNGYQTRIGQRGMMLSGGQRQRIALARAIIRDAPVLLLDEPTTGLDAASAARVLEPLRRAMAGRTTVVISHNLLTVTDVDRIVYLEQGRVGGYGTHTELMARCPGYAELYRLHHPDQPGLPPIPYRPEARPNASPRPHPRPAPQVRPGPQPRPHPHPRPSPGPRPRPRPGVARVPVVVPAVPAPLSAVLPLLPQVSGLATQPVRAVRPDRSGDGRPVAIPLPRRQGGPVGTPATRPVAAPPEPVQRATPDPLPGGASSPVRWEDDDWVR